MAISVKDIQEKEFATQVSGGYNVDQVDDFLDEVAEQYAALIRDNLALVESNKKLNAELEDNKKALEEALTQKPDYNEKSYFEHLQSAMRDSLISAQRVADELVNNAKAEAEKLHADAQAEAQAVTSKARSDAESVTSKAKQEAETLASKAKAEAEALTAKAKEEAEKLTESSRKAAESAKAEFEQLRTAAATYRSNFSKMVEDHMSILKSNDTLFK